MNWPIVLAFGLGFANGLWLGIQSTRARYWQAAYFHKKMQLLQSGRDYDREHDQP